MAGVGSRFSCSILRGRFLTDTVVILVHPTCRLAQRTLQFFGQFVTDPPRCALQGQHLTPDLTEIGAVGAGLAGKLYG
jgi:hypothetical protein